jgi:hypothetical protein
VSHRQTGFESGNVIRPAGARLRIDERVKISRFSQGLIGPVRSAITRPLHRQVGQTSNVGSSVAVPVCKLSARKSIRTPLYALEREAESFSNAPASLITTRVRETDSPHLERTEGITH